MDGHRFDSITRDLASGITRRDALRRLALGLTASALAILERSDAEAAKTCRVGGQVCRKNGDCCDGRCGSPDKTGRRLCNGCPNGGCNTCVDSICKQAKPPAGSPLCSVGFCDGVHNECQFGPVTDGRICDNSQPCSGIGYCNEGGCTYADPVPGASCDGGNGTCVDGSCCATANVCGEFCCGPDQTCCNGECRDTGTMSNCNGQCQVCVQAEHEICEVGTCCLPDLTSSCDGLYPCCSGDCKYIFPLGYRCCARAGVEVVNGDEIWCCNGAGPDNICL